MGRIHSSRALYFASRAGAPAGKKSLRQRTGPLAIRSNVSVPDGKPLNLRDRANASTGLAADVRLLISTEIMLYDGIPCDDPFKNAATKLTAKDKRLIKAEVKEMMDREKEAETEETTAWRQRTSRILWEDSRRLPEAEPKGSVRTSEEPERPIKTVLPKILGPLILSTTTPVKIAQSDFPFFSCEELGQPTTIAPSNFPVSTFNELERLSMTAQPSFFNIQGPAEETVDQNPDFPLFSCEELGQPSTIASSNLPFFTLEQMLAKTEETMEQKLVRAETEEAVRARKSFNTPSMPTCWGPEQPFQASRQDFFGPPSQDIATPEKRTAGQMQVAAAIRARGGSGVPFRARTGIPLAKVANPMAMPGSIPSAPLQGHPQAEKPKSRDFPTAHTIVKKIYAAALAAAGTNVVQFEEAVRIIYN